MKKTLKDSPETSINLKFLRNLNESSDRIHKTVLVKTELYQSDCCEVKPFYKPISKIVSYK